MNFKRIITLTQHTPIIHFQFDQPGSTLRMTELKPKLDRFLWEQLAGDNLKNWLVPGQSKALAYKIRIGKVKDDTSWNLDKNYPFYFGKLGKGDSKKDSMKNPLKFSNKVTLEFRSFHVELLDAIEKRLPAFFSCTNFGTRQSKGFGSFLPENTKPDPADFHLWFTIPVDRKSCRNLKLDSPELKGWPQDDSEETQTKRLFYQLEIFYRSLRGGINRPVSNNNKTKFYIKPAIFHFAKDVLNQQWDKKSVKQQFFPAVLQEQIEKQVRKKRIPDVLSYESQPIDGKHGLFKELFGLSTHESWRSYHSTITRNHPEISRFQSPWFFKPFRIDANTFQVGIKVQDIPSEFLNQTFQIENKPKTKLPLELKTPEEFDWNDFLTYLKTEIPSLDERCTSDSGLQNQPEYQVLKAIYKQLN